MVCEKYATYQSQAESISANRLHVQFHPSGMRYPIWTIGS